MSRVITDTTSGSGAGAGTSTPFNPALVIDDTSTSTTKTWSAAAWGDGTRDIIINTLEAETLNIKQQLTSEDPIADINSAGAANPQVGIRAVSPTGAAPNYQMVYETARAAWTAGQEGSEKVIALREDAPDEARAFVYDSATGELVSKPASVNTYYVDKTGADTNDGQTEESAFLTIAAATAVAVSGDTIVLSNNDFAENVVLPDGVHLRGLGASLTGSGTVLELGDGSCVRISGVTCTGGQAVNLNKSGGSARVFLNVVTGTGSGDAFRCQTGALDIVCGNVTTVNGDIVAETNADRVNITVSRVEVTGTGNCFRTQGGGKVTCQASQIVCGSGNVFDSNAPSSASIDVTCARLEADDLSDIGSNVEATLVASLATGTLTENGAGSVTYLVPTGASDNFSVGGTLSTSSVASVGNLNIDAAGDLTVGGQSMVFTVDGGASSDFIRFRCGTGVSRVWTLFQRATPSGSDCVSVGTTGVTGTGQATIAAVDSGVTTYRPLYIGFTSSPLPSVTISATTTSVSGTLEVDTIAENTAAAGVTVDGVLLKDSSVEADGISFDSGTNTLSDFIDTTTETLTYSGPCTSNTADVHLVRIGPMVHLTFDTTVLLGNSTPTQLVTTAISSNFRPATAQHIAAILDPGTGTSVMGSVLVNTNGVLTFYPSPEADGSNDFNTAGIIGWNSQTITWNATA